MSVGVLGYYDAVNSETTLVHILQQPHFEQIVELYILLNLLSCFY